MIVFDKTTKSFCLIGRTYSYCMYVNSMGYLVNLHYGKKLDVSDIPYFINTDVVPSRDDLNADMATNGMPLEMGGFGKGDYRAATVIVRRKDGGAMSSFKYASHRIVRGATALDGLPCVRKADETLVVTLADEYSDTEIDLYYTVSDNSDVLTRHAVIRNVGKACMDIVKAYSFCMDLPDANGAYSALRLAGSWASERKPVTTPLGEGTLRIGSTRGYSSHQMNPFLAILKDNCDEDNGECYGFNLIYSGSFAVTAEMSSDGTVRVQGGINEYMFGWRLNGGEAFTTPQAALCYSSEGIGGMSRSYHDYYRECIINPSYVNKRRPIVINNWEATYFDFDEKKLFAIIDEAAKLGIDTFVLDDGWFGKRNDDRSGLGDWTVNDGKLKGGLKAVIDRCKQNGMKFGLWIEPEMVSEDSELYRAHPDWAIAKKGVKPSRGRNQLILDLTKQEVVDYIFTVISEILKSNDISYVKWDKNRDMTEFWSDGLPADRQGEFVHRYTLGFYYLAKKLTTAFPDVLFEGCAGGGGRFDGGALYYFPQIWTSDDTDALERTKIQWGTSVCYPLSSMSCHVSACPNHQTQRITPFDTRGIIASLGATGYELDLTKLTDDEKQKVKEQIANYKRVDGLILDGDLYRLSNPFATNYFCEITVSKDKTRAYLAGERKRGDPSDRDRILKLKGLDENKTYYISELNVTASGRALMSAGVLYPRLPDCGGWAWHIEEVK